MNIHEIKVNDRQREELESDEYPIHELASSIRRTHGLVHPIVVDHEANLIAGGRRLEGLKLLHLSYPAEGWDSTPVTVRAEVDEDQRYTMELEENLHRKSLTPQEYHTALLEFHNRQTANNPTNIRGPVDPAKPRWTKDDTAGALGISRTKAYDDIRIAEVVSLMPEEQQAEIYKKAGTNLDLVGREVTQLVERSAKKIEAKERLKKEDEEAKLNPNKREEVRHCDSLEGLRSLADSCVDLVITDPPYGVVEGSAGEKGLGHTTYDDRNFSDNDEDTWELLGKVIPELYRVLKPNSHVYMFCAIGYSRKCAFHTLAPVFERCGFHVRDLPLIWCKPSQGFKPPFTTWPLNYETILFATTGRRDKEGPPPHGDVITAAQISGPHKKHRFEKPEDLIRQLINASIEPDGNFLDPFCGSGALLGAARKKWMRVQGFDLDPEAITAARERLGLWDAQVLESNGVEQGMKMLERVKRW